MREKLFSKFVSRPGRSADKFIEYFFPHHSNYPSVSKISQKGKTVNNYDVFPLCQVFHFGCIKKWSRSATAEQHWRCPGCQVAVEASPRQYRCFCGKVTSCRLEQLPASAVFHFAGSKSGVEQERGSGAAQLRGGVRPPPGHRRQLLSPQLPGAVPPRPLQVSPDTLPASADLCRPAPAPPPSPRPAPAAPPPSGSSARWRWCATRSAAACSAAAHTRAGTRATWASARRAW